ncbi:MAG: portal protein, partial [Planctomycetota bacterium]
MAKRKLTPSNAKETIEFAGELIIFGLEGLKNSGVLDTYKKSVDYHNGDHSIRTTRSKKKGNYVDNKFAEIIDNRIAHLTDSRPKWNFLPQEETDAFTALALNQILGDVVWDFTEWDDRAEDSVQDALFAGSTHIKTNFDARTGLPLFEVCECGSVIPDPKAIGKNEIRFIIHVSAMSLAEIRRQFRDTFVQVDKKGSVYDIISEIELEKFIAEKGSTLSSPQGSWYTQVQSTGGITFPFVFPASFSQIGQYKMENIWGQVQATGDDRTKFMPDAIGRALVWEIYFDDDTREKIPFDEGEVAEEHVDFSAGIDHPVGEFENHVEHAAAHRAELDRTDPETQEIKYSLLTEHIRRHELFPPDEDKPVYPNGRRIVASQGKLLADMPNPMPVAWRDIFIKWDILKKRRSYWGKAMTKDLFDLQDMRNHRVNMIHQNINLCTNGYYKYKSSLQKWIKENKAVLSNIVAKGIPVNNMDDFVVEFGQPLPQHFFQEAAMIEQIMERRTGEEGLSAGRYPQGSPPGITVSQLLQEGKTIIRMMTRHYSNALKQMGRNAIAIMVEFLDDSHKFQIVGADNQPQMIKWEDLRNKAGLYDIRVDVASMLATSRQERFRQALELAQAGVYDAKAVLDSIDDPRKYEVSQRLDLIAQQGQQIEQLVQENEEIKKLLNTLQNRQQS